MIKLNYKIYGKLPIDIVNIILSLYYGPLDYVIYKKKKLLNNEIINQEKRITLNIISDKDYSDIPELDIFNGEPWYDYLNAYRLPKLIKT